jgi:predicted NBD/HSP70 family sugar kinase
MSSPRIRTARGLLLYGKRVGDGTLSRKRFLEQIAVDNGTLRSAADKLGAKGGSEGLRFFDSSRPNRIAFGPSAGLVIGVSVGNQSLRAVLLDANGISRASYEGGGIAGQLEEAPEILLDRIQEAAGAVVAAGLDQKELRVEGALPLLGVSVAWPGPLTRGKLPVGNALGHFSWRNGTAVDDRVADHLGIEKDRSHAMNDLQAAAIAVAYDRTMHREHLNQRYVQPVVTVRIAAGIGAGMVVIAPPQDDPDLGPTSGFGDSVLLKGVDDHSGEIGHTPVNLNLVHELNARPGETTPPLIPSRCSCAPPEAPELGHLESYIGALALAARIDPDSPPEQVVAEVVADPEDDRHRLPLEDVGLLLGDALVGPLAMLNPASVMTTGTLALDPVERGVKTVLSRVHHFGTMPAISLLKDPEENKLIRARGAALLVFRRHVFNEFPDLLGGGDEKSVREKVRALTKPLPTNPWEPILGIA